MNEVYVDIRKLDLADKLGQDMISVEALLREYEDALYKIKNLEEQIKDMLQDIEDNYRPIPRSEQECWQ